VRRALWAGLAAAVVGLPGAAQQIVLHPRVFNDVPASALTVTKTSDSVSISDRNVSAATGYANRHDWRLSPDGVADQTFGPSDTFDLSADVTLTGDPTSPRKEAGLRINGPCGDALFMVNTDAHEVVGFSASGSVLPAYNFRLHGVADYQSGQTVRLRMQYLSQGGVNGFILSVDGITSPFLPAGGSQAGICAGSTVGGYLQIQNAPAAPTNTGIATFTSIHVSTGQPPALTDAELLDRTEAQACAYASSMLVTTPATTGFPNGRAMLADNTNSTVCSVGATGFGLTCLAIEASRYGSSEEWTVTPEAARAKANAILDTVLEMQAGGVDMQYGGLPYHFAAAGADGRFRRASGSEVSTADGALLIEGALAAGQRFGAEVRDKALRAAANVQWSAFRITVSGQKRYSMSWQPEKDNSYSIPAGSGYLNQGNWDRPTDEILLISLLGIGNEPDSADALKAWYGYPRVRRSYVGGNSVTYPVVNSYFGSLFTYTQSHGYIPFNRLGADHPEDAGGAVPAVDWWANSVAACLASRQYSIDHAPGQAPADGYATHAAFSPNSWGLTAAVNPANLGDYKGLLGAPPIEANGGAPQPEGIIAPYAALSAMPLLRTAPDESLTANPGFNALRHYYDVFYGSLFGPFGPKEAFDDALNVANVYLGIDAPLEGVNIEAYRTGQPSAWFSLAPPVADAIARIYHTGLAPGDLDLDGAVTPADCAQILRIAGGLAAPTPAQRYNGDLNADGRVSLEDALTLVKTLR
jgi:hypothetical protein